MNELSRQEFAALRGTIQARGVARSMTFLAGFASWAAILVATIIWLGNPIAAVVPLLMLVATFEVVRSLHLGVERIGRYIQVFFEEDATGRAVATGPAWEHTAMVFGPSLPGAGTHPFFLPLFMLATMANFLAVLLPSPLQVEIATLAVPHLAFVVWMFYGDRAMRKQRTTELTRYRALKASLTDDRTPFSEPPSHVS
jgi:hypothetical protein